MKERMKLWIPIVALLLEFLPNGAVLNFATPDGEPIRQTFSYFSPIPFGYANIAPFLTAILTVVIIITALLSLLKKSKRIAVVLSILSWAASAVSLFPLFYGLRYFSFIGFLISFSLLFEALLSIRAAKQE